MATKSAAPKALSLHLGLNLLGRLPVPGQGFGILPGPAGKVA
jgi:hypothetical protein